MNFLVLKIIAFFSIFLLWTYNSNSEAKSYFVAPTGNDSHNGLYPTYKGGVNGPFKTISKGAKALDAGDQLNLRAGTYTESVVIGNNGTQDAPILICSYPGEWAVIDGQYNLPTKEWDSLFGVTGHYIQVKDLEIRNSNWLGLVIKGFGGQAINVQSHHHMETGILLSGDYSSAISCKVWRNAKRNEDGRGYPNGGWASGLSAARHPSHASIRNCVVWNNWGEGLSTFESEFTVLEDNIVYDNQTNIYISDSIGCLCQRNLIYSTPNNSFSKSVGRQVGIMMGDEKYNPPSSDNTVINNFCVGNSKNFYWWQGSFGGGLVNALIAHNTFVNSVDSTNIQISRGTHINSQFINNIILQEDSLPVAIVDTKVGFTYSHNLWSKKPPLNSSGDFDIIANPMIKRIGSVSQGLLTPEYFKISASSPARDHGISIGRVREDFFRSNRDNQPDMGGHEFCEAKTLMPHHNSH
jgi:hypothetical protein